MNVLLPVFDLYRQKGGGETIYRQIIALMKDCTFYYLLQDESPNAERPANAVGIPFQFHYSNARALQPKPDYLYENFLNAMNIGHAVARAHPGMRFDIVDLPDYQQCGIFLGQALNQHGIQYGQMVLALHGVVSQSVKSNWLSGSDAVRRQRLAKLRILEGLQYQLVDHRYAISETYAARWDKKYPGLSCTIVDPLVFMDVPTEFPRIDHQTKPDIYFIGRKERTKGPDIFLDLIWFLPKSVYRRAMLIGPEEPTGQGSQSLLSRAAALRGITHTNLPPQERQKVLELFQHKAINVVTSRYETLSLSALESLLHGCPTVISKYCGIVPYLKTHHPSIPFYEIDLTCARDGAQQLQQAIDNYDAVRAQLIAAVKALPKIDKAMAIRAIYAGQHSVRQTTKQTIDKLFTTFCEINDRASQQLTYQIRRTLRKTGLPKLKNMAKKRLGKHLGLLQELKWQWAERGHRQVLAASLKRVAKHFLKDAKSAAQWYFSLSAKRLKPAADLQPADINASIAHFEDLVAYRHVDRATYYQALSALENQRQNPLMSAVYQTRLLRWQGNDARADLTTTLNTLQTKGYVAEAEALRTIHSPEAAQLAYLQKKLADNKDKPDLPLEILDDRRAKQHYKVSVIVSLYNAASKLPTFFRMLDQQTLIQSGDVEVALIDSGSPTAEYAAFQQYQGPLKNAIVYARSANRETIQAAWNRGIKLCRGTYLTFQAVDEALHPECLTILSQELDEHPGVDWIMGSALVAEINKQEILHTDVMAYDRSDARPYSHIFDCTFVNYTPGLYRSSVHERFGYYDESFRAAGDTEFKNRVSPFITLKFIPHVLGAYNNYQEERTTAHPRAEIEDIRAWYLFRTPAGVAYLFQNKSEAELLAILRDTLGYRKAYCQHLSTDIDLGHSVAAYLYKKTGNALYQTLQQDYQTLIALCNQIENITAERAPIMTVAKATRAFAKTKRHISKQLQMTDLPTISIFHDNRYEQHWWPWRNTV